MSVRRTPRLVLSGLLIAATAALSFAAGVPAAYADGPTITGAGSTFSQIAIDQWRSDVAQKYGLAINYQGNGSTSGRQFYLNNQVDFAASEIPFQSDELQKLQAEGKSFAYSPIVAGATSIMYNLTANGGRVVDLKLDAATLGGIFTGRITTWGDPAIAKLNPGEDLSGNGTITPTIRSDGSGTTAQFTAYLRSQDYSDWGPFAKANQNGDDSSTSNYPNFGNAYAASGSDGVANQVQQNPGSITYVETGYAIERNFPVASMLNASGAYTQPTSDNVATALAKATLNSDHTQNLQGVYTNPAATAYPISSYSYFIVPTAGISTDKGKVLGEFMLYFACVGQQKASVLGYSPLPPNLVQTVFDVVSQIPGAPTPPPLSQCANPTIPGAVDGGVPGTGTTGTGAAAPPGTGQTTTSTGTGSTTTTTTGGPATKPGTTAVKPGTTAVKPGTTAVKPGTSTAVKPGATSTSPGAVAASGGAVAPTGAVAAATGPAAVAPVAGGVTEPTTTGTLVAGGAVATGGVAAAQVPTTGTGAAAPVAGSGAAAPVAGAAAPVTSGGTVAGGTVATGTTGLANAGYVASQAPNLSVRAGSGAGVALPAVVLVLLLLVPPALAGPVLALRRKRPTTTP